MKDGSDAIADWPILNASINTAAGAHWVSAPRGRCGTGMSIHAGMVVVADGSRTRPRAWSACSRPTLERARFVTRTPDTSERSRSPPPAVSASVARVIRGSVSPAGRLDG